MKSARINITKTIVSLKNKKKINVFEINFKTDRFVNSNSSLPAAGGGRECINGHEPGCENRLETRVRPENACFSRRFELETVERRRVAVSGGRPAVSYAPTVLIIIAAFGTPLPVRRTVHKGKHARAAASIYNYYVCHRFNIHFLDTRQTVARINLTFDTHTATHSALRSHR